MKRLFLLLLLTLTACKREGTEASAEAEALDYVRLASIAVSNAYYESGKPVPPTPCTSELFGLKKTTKFLKLDRCTARKDSENTVLVAALFNGNIAIVSDENGTRRVNASELPEVK